MSDDKNSKKIELVLFLVVALVVGGATTALNYCNRTPVKPKQEVKKASKVNDTIQAMFDTNVRGGAERY